MISVILVLGFLLRLVNLNQSLWLDEAIGALVVKGNSFLGILTFAKGDNHPPLYYLVLKAWTMVFGYSEVSLRMLSVLFGTATIVLIYLIAKKLLAGKNPSTALISAIFLATSPLDIYYSQEARMYIFAGFWAALAVYSFLVVIERQTSRLFWLIFSLSVTALVFSDYVPVFLIPVFWIFALIKGMNKGWWLKFLLAQLPLVVFGVLWLPTLSIQAQGGSWLLAKLPDWRQIAGGATLKELGLVWMKFVLGRISLSDKLVYYSLVGVASLPFIFSFFLSLRSEKRHRIVWLWLIFPLVTVFLVSFLLPAFTYFRFIFVLPAFYLLAALGIAGIKNTKLRFLVTSSIVAINLVGWGIYVLDVNQQREMWRQAVAFVESEAKQGDVAVFDYPEPFAPYRWYAKGTVPAVGVADSISVDPAKTSKITKEAVSGKKGVYFFEYLVDLTDPGRTVEKTLNEQGFRISKVYGDFVGVGQIEYFVR